MLSPSYCPRRRASQRPSFLGQGGQLNDALRGLQASIDECTAVLAVDVRAGSVLSATGSATAQHLDVLPVAGTEILESRGIGVVDAILSRQRTAQSPLAPKPMSQAILRSVDGLVIVQRCESKQDLALVVVCSASPNLALVLASIHRALPHVESFL
jgi:hypothetical protein